jgi:hypothetical protein
MDTYQQTLEEHNAKRTDQTNACAICRRPFSQYQAYQDHDHKCCARPRKKEGRYCGKCNRGLLCFLCNKKAVAWLEQLAKWGIDIEKVLEYIRFWTREITLKGGYASKAPKAKTPRKRKSKAGVPRKQKSVRPSSEPSAPERGSDSGSGESSEVKWWRWEASGDEPSRP